MPVNAPYPPPLGVVQNDVAAPGDGVEARGAGGKRSGVSEWQESSAVQIDAWQIGRHLGHRLETMDRAGLPLGVRRHQLPNSRAGMMQIDQGFGPAEGGGVAGAEGVR